MTQGERGSAKEMPETIWIRAGRGNGLAFYASTYNDDQRAERNRAQSSENKDAPQPGTLYIRADKYAALRRLAEAVVSETDRTDDASDVGSSVRVIPRRVRDGINALRDFLKEDK